MREKKSLTTFKRHHRLLHLHVAAFFSFAISSLATSGAGVLYLVVAVVTGHLSGCFRLSWLPVNLLVSEVSTRKDIAAGWRGLLIMPQ